MTGILYSIGVGPGDPELLTRKAERLIRSCPVLAAPGGRDSTSFRIAVQAIPEITEKPCLSLRLPMTRDPQVLKESHRLAAEQVAEVLKSGQDVALLTLGDPSIYSTCIYIQNQIQAMGFSYQMVAGVPSFCAAAAALGESLTEADKPLRILPASYPCAEPELDAPGVKILMKSGKQFANVKRLLTEKGLSEHTSVVQNCGMPGEALYPTLSQTGDTAGYFSILIVKEL